MNAGRQQVRSDAVRRSTPCPYGRTTSAILLVLFISASVQAADPAAQAIREGNALFADGQYTEAINKYNEALVEQPAALEPKFNKANGYYRLDDLGEAIDLYQEVAAESKDMTLVAKAKYNLGNCLFQRGTKQRDSDLRKALEDMETSITYWRGVLDIEPENEKAAENIEVARLTIKDILDQIEKQQEQQQQGQQDQQQQQQQQGEGQQQQGQRSDQGQSGSQGDPNQPQDPSQAQPTQSQPDPNESQGDRQPEQEQAREQQDQRQTQPAVVPDATAQEILDKEQRQNQERQIRQRGSMPRVERDW